MQFLSDISPNIIAVGIGVIIGGALAYLLFLPRAKEYFDEEGGHKRKILELIGARGLVSGADVEKYLAVPHEEAARELAELVQRDVIRETHKSGASGVFYEAAARKKWGLR